MEGIDSFIGRYGLAGVQKCAEAFQSVGAAVISEGLRVVGGCLPDCAEGLLEEVNSLITSRAGYDYDAIRRLVASYV